LDQLHRDMGRGAERAVGVGVGAVCVGVRDLHRAGNRHQEHANQREENSPRASCARFGAGSSHSRTIAQLGSDEGAAFPYRLAATPGVISPMFSTWAWCAMSITSAILLNSRELSAFTNMTFSCRLANMAASFCSS
jgi:hypothetical protein